MTTEDRELEAIVADVDTRRSPGEIPIYRRGGTTVLKPTPKRKARKSKRRTASAPFDVDRVWRDHRDKPTTKGDEDQ